MFKRRKATETKRTGNQILSQLNKGKTISQIAKKLNLPEQDVEKRFYNASKSLSAYERKKIRKNAGLTPLKKFSRKKAEEIISMSKKLIRSEASLLSKTPWNKITMAKNNPKKLKTIIRELRFTRKSFKSIARIANVRETVVKNIFNILKEIGRPVEERKKKKRHDLSRITHIFNAKQIRELIKKFEPNIGNSTNKIYKEYKMVFDSANISPEKIADFIRKSLEWKIKTFNPMKRKGKNLEIEIRNYCTKQIRFLAVDKLEQAFRAYNRNPKTISLETELKGEDQKKLTLANIVAVKKQPASDSKKVITVIENFAKKAKLTIEEKAIIYGKAAGMTYLELREISTLSTYSIGKIIENIRKKGTNAGLKPVINSKAHPAKFK